MHIKSLILAAAAALAISSAAFAQTAVSVDGGGLNDGPFAGCNGCAMPVQEYEAKIAAWNASQVPSEGGGDTYVPPVDPVTEVPATPLKPGTPAPGVYYGNLTGTPYANYIPTDGVFDETIQIPAGVVINGVTIEPGHYSVIVAPNGMFRISPVVS